MPSPNILGTQLTDPPNTSVSAVELGFTFYLSEALFWAQEGAGRALESFLQRVPPDRFAWYTTSLLAEWHRAGGVGAPKLASSLSYWMLAKPRHLFSFDLVDDTDVPSYGFSYREYDPTRGGPRASVLEVTLPQQHDPIILLDLVRALADIGPFWCGVGGYAFRWNRNHKNTAFWRGHDVGQRYLGVDMQDTEEMSWSACAALPGTNWLTLIGKPLAGIRPIDLSILGAQKWVNDISLGPAGPGVLVRAGQEPAAGDRNRLEYPMAYAEVARALAPHFAEPPPELWGQFFRQKDSRAWFRRFLEPDAWQ